MLVREPQLRATLRRLPGRKFVFSNAPVHYSRAVLRALAIADLFDDVFSIEHTRYRPKPDSHGFLRLCRANHLRPQRCIMVEDSARQPEDRQAAGHEDGVGDGGREGAGLCRCEHHQSRTVAARAGLFRGEDKKWLRKQGREQAADPADAGADAGSPRGGEDHHRGARRQARRVGGRALPPFQRQGADVRRIDRVHRADAVRADQQDQQRRKKRRAADSRR